MDYYEKYIKYKNKYLHLKGGLNCDNAKAGTFETCKLFDEFEKTLKNILFELQCIAKDYKKLSNDKTFVDNLTIFSNSIKLPEPKPDQIDDYLEYYLTNYMATIHELFYGYFLFYSFYKNKIIKHSKTKLTRTKPCDQTIDINSFQLFIGQKLTKIILLLTTTKKNAEKNPEYTKLSNLLANEIIYCDNLLRKMI
jgi:hypothetical protein